MLTSTIKRNAFRVVATLAFAAAPAFASLIPVNNFSFETVPVGGFPIACTGTCVCSLAAIPGWGGTAVVRGEAQYGTTNGRFTSLSSDGTPTSAFSNDGIISQTLGFTVGVGTVYTLLVDIGERVNGGVGGQADLRINGTPYIATPVAGLPSSGGWAIYKATYTGNATDAAAGASITIELQNINPNYQANFDNVQLTGVPEPASFLLIGSALLALKAFRRRRPIA